MCPVHRMYQFYIFKLSHPCSFSINIMKSICVFLVVRELFRLDGVPVVIDYNLV